MDTHVTQEYIIFSDRNCPRRNVIDMLVRDPRKTFTKGRRGRRGVLTAISSAKQPHTRVETRKAHDLSADLALHLRYDYEVGPLQLVRPMNHVAGTRRHGFQNQTLRVMTILGKEICQEKGSLDSGFRNRRRVKGWRVNIARARVCTADLPCKNLVRIVRIAGSCKCWQ